MNTASRSTATRRRSPSISWIRSSTQGLPTQCDNCIDTAGVSISLRNYEDKGSADIKINDPNNVLPSPFPVFDSWTEFREDEYVNGG